MHATVFWHTVLRAGSVPPRLVRGPILRGRTIFRLAFRFSLLIGLVSIVLAAAPARATEIKGKATIIDSGTIEIGNRRIRLYGIEAPADNQTCMADGKMWNCGREATWALAYELAEHWLICRDKGLGSAVCFIGGIHDVGERMVRKGWARADRQLGLNYVEAETEARTNRAGLWRTTIK